MIINKKVKEIKTDGNCTIIEFEDNMLLPLYNVPVKTIDTTCIYCKHSNVEKNLLSLDGKNYICTDCLSSLIQMSLKNGIDIQFNLAEVNQTLADKLKSFINAPEKISEEKEDECNTVNE